MFCFLSGVQIDAPDDDAYVFVIAIADGSIDDVRAIAAQLAAWSRPLTAQNG